MYKYIIIVTLIALFTAINYAITPKYENYFSSQDITDK
jgi:hypothetical protein